MAMSYDYDTESSPEMEEMIAKMEDKSLPLPKGILSITVDEIIEEEYDEAFKEDAIQIGISDNAVYELLPMIFTPSGKIRTAPGKNGRVTHENIVARVEMGLKARRIYEESMCCDVVIDLPCGHLELSSELSEWFGSKDKFIALADKGWTFRAIKCL